MGQKGFSLIEVMFAVGITSVLTLIIYSSSEFMGKTSREKTEAVAMMDVRQGIFNCVDSNSSVVFALTDAANLELQCLGILADCRPFVGNAYSFRPNSGPNTLCMGWDGMNPTNGFTRQGAVCNTFSIDGNDACPYRYDIRWEPICHPEELTCPQPILRIVGTMLYRPSNLAAPPPFNISTLHFQSTIDLRKRELGRILLEERLPHDRMPGACGNRTWRTRGLTTVAMDTTAAVLPLKPPGDPTFPSFILQPGIYECEVTAPAYRVGGHKVRLAAQEGSGSFVTVMSGQTAFSDPGPTAGYASSVSRAFGRFKLDRETTMVVQHWCQQGSTNDYELGENTNSATIGTSVFARVECLKVH